MKLIFYQQTWFTKQSPTTCSWLVCRLGLEGFHVSGGGGLKGIGGGAEGGFWLLPASSPSPIAEVGCSGWADTLGRLDLAGAGGTGGNPFRPFHSSRDSLKEPQRKTLSLQPLWEFWHDFLRMDLTFSITATRRIWNQTPITPLSRSNHFLHVLSQLSVPRPQPSVSI